jgi:hypothetical protein
LLTAPPQSGLTLPIEAMRFPLSSESATQTTGVTGERNVGAVTRVTAHRSRLARDISRRLTPRPESLGMVVTYPGRLGLAPRGAAAFLYRWGWPGHPAGAVAETPRLCPAGVKAYWARDIWLRKNRTCAIAFTWPERIPLVRARGEGDRVSPELSCASPEAGRIFLFGFAVTHSKAPNPPNESKEKQAFFLGFIWIYLHLFCPQPGQARGVGSARPRAD